MQEALKKGMDGKSDLLRLSYEKLLSIKHREHRPHNPRPHRIDASRSRRLGL